MRRVSPRAWLGLAVLSLLSLVITFFIGAFAGGKDIDETCAAAGQPLDDAYRARHWQEPGQLFPMHNRCNAQYDLVPAWVNPALVIFAVASAVFLVAFIASATPHLARKFRR